MANDDWTRHGPHPVKKSHPESYVAFCEFALGRSLRIIARMVTRWIQNKNLNFLRKDISGNPQKYNSQEGGGYPLFRHIHKINSYTHLLDYCHYYKDNRKQSCNNRSYSYSTGENVTKNVRKGNF